MELSRVFKTPHERFKISHLLIKIYDLVEFSLIKRICYLINSSQDPNIIWKSLQVATLYAAGIYKIQWITISVYLCYLIK